MTWTEVARTSELGARRLDTRAKLISAAAEVFQELGYGPTTVADIVARAEVSRATFYLYFAGKEDVYRAHASVFGGDIADRFRILDKILASGSRDDFGAWFEDFVAWATANYRTYVVWSEAQGRKPDVSIEIWRTTVASWLAVMPWYRSQWRGGRRREAFTRLGLFVGQIQFFHHSLLTAAERRIALQLLSDLWFAELRPPS